jgi:hypothetical protein
LKLLYLNKKLKFSFFLIHFFRKFDHYSKAHSKKAVQIGTAHHPVLVPLRNENYCGENLSLRGYSSKSLFFGYNMHRKTNKGKTKMILTFATIMMICTRLHPSLFSQQLLSHNNKLQPSPRKYKRRQILAMLNKLTSGIYFLHNRQ